MAIAFDQTTRINNIGSPSTNLSGNVTVGTGSSRVLIVFVSWNAGSVSSVTYAGVAMQYTGYTSVSGSGNGAYILVNPPSGTNTLSITTSLSATIVAEGLAYTDGHAASHSFNAVDTGAVTSGATGGSSVSTNITPFTDKCWIVAWGRSNGTLTFGGGDFTQRTLANNCVSADTNGPVDRNVLKTFTTGYTPSGSINNHTVVAFKASGLGAELIPIM